MMAKILKYKFMKKRSEQSISIMSIIRIFVKVYELGKWLHSKKR